MSNFFNVDNGFFAVLSKICDIFFLSIVWVILCIPIITIGPANTAMYYATVKVIRRERGYLFREFFKSFRLNFGRAAIIGVVLTALFAVLIIDIVSSRAGLSKSTSTNSVLFGIYIAITFLLLCISVYIFPVLSRFDMKIKQLIKAAAFMSMRHLPYTLGMAIIQIAAIVASIYIPMLIFIVPALATFASSFLMERVLKKYMPQAEETEENESRDEWYLE